LRNFLCLYAGVPTLDLVQALALRGDLWNQDTFRTQTEGLPFVGTDDILVRYPEPQEDAALRLQDASPVWRRSWITEDNEAPFLSLLPQVRPIIHSLMCNVPCEALGRVVISRLAPGASILPHADNVGGYTDLRGAARYHVVLQGEAGNLFHCGNETVEMRTGQVWWFNQKLVHSVENKSASERLHLLVDLVLLP